MNVAFIPVRGGSKSIPLKNIKLINGKPLVYWTIKAACDCDYIEKVYVSTDSSEIKSVCMKIKDNLDSPLLSKIEIIDRNPENALDTSSTESAMLEFSEKYEFENICLIQATSPLLCKEDLDNGFKLFNLENVDSVLSVARIKRFIWEIDKEGYGLPVNYNLFKRPRRQEFDGILVENGAFYITSKRLFIKNKNRISGNIKVVEMSEDSFVEIDEPNDFLIVESLMKKKKAEFSYIIPEIKIFLTDCDGCLTDGGMYYSEFGDELKKFNTRDGVGFELLRKKGIITGIITSEAVNLNFRRAQKLKVDIFESGCMDKAKVIRKICHDYNVTLSNVCYIGDDINDIEAIKIAGFGCVPSNAVSQVKEVADYVAKTVGGSGIIREVADLILHDK